MKAALLQFAPAYLDVRANLDRAEALLEGVDADLIVLPELFASGYFFRSEADVASVAEPIPEGPTTQHLQQWAASSGATFVAGLPELGNDGQRYNSAVVARPDGTTATYRKVHLFYREKDWFAPGDLGFRVFEATTRDGTAYRLGVMICFDWYFPEAARSLALQGADVIAHPSNLVRKDCPRSMPIRALENHVVTITANRTGTETAGDEALTFIGRSVICSPQGHPLASAGREETTVLTAAFDPLASRDRQLTATNHLFRDRRPDVYTLGG
ncbi:MAG: nitrilase-related carbon-nitrogen hydrolase [Bacteroidota bacterium]